MNDDYHDDPLWDQRQEEQWESAHAPDRDRLTLKQHCINEGCSASGIYPGDPTPDRP